MSVEISQNSPACIVGAFYFMEIYLDNLYFKLKRKFKAMEEVSKGKKNHLSVYVLHTQAHKLNLPH